MARTWAEIEALEPTEAERRLIEACRQGEPCSLGDDRPERADPARTIRAEILRYLILGGCEDCQTHEWGVWVGGAYIDGELDLSFTTARGPVSLRNCRFTHGFIALQMRLEALTLIGSSLPELNIQGSTVTGSVLLRSGFSVSNGVNLARAIIGGQLACDGGVFQNPDGHALSAQGIRVTGDVFLGGDFVAKGEVNLFGAVIGGQLDCNGGSFLNPNSHALNAQGIRITGDAFLRGDFVAKGEVNLSGATVGGQLICDGGSFLRPEDHALNAQGIQVGSDLSLSDGFFALGEVRLAGAAINGQFTCVGGHFQNSGDLAFNAQGLQVRQSFLWRSVKVTDGAVHLSPAYVGDLVDDLESWPEGERLILHGFTYERISGAFTDSRQRLEWLKRGTVWNDEFLPQPYTQLAKVLREMGHDSSARDVLVEQGRLIRLYARRHGWRLLRPVRWLGDVLQRWIIGYGYKPFRSVIAAGLLWGLATWFAYMAWHTDAMVPNSDVILTSPGWQALADQPGPAKNWTAKGAPGQDWEVFNSLAWGFDVVVPIIQVGQIEAWAPSTTRGFWGQAAWWGRWGLSIAGWVVIALATAAVTGIIRRE